MTIIIDSTNSVTNITPTAATAPKNYSRQPRSNNRFSDNLFNVIIK